jgi:1-acyl-sn-glycerol-3-phosphate acyltransferase
MRQVISFISTNFRKFGSIHSRQLANSLSMTNSSQRFLTPRRQVIRSVLQWLSKPALKVVAELEIRGQENLPKSGPLIVVGNHFSFIDPVCFVRLAPWQIEFVGGAVMPHAPLSMRIFPLLWGYHPLYRGTGAKDSLIAAEKILNQGGVLGYYLSGWWG